MDDGLVTNRDDYNLLRKQESGLFSLDNGGLPDQVFLEGFSSFRFCEFDLMLQDEFWPLLSQCAKLYGDSSISLIVHDPDPEEYFFRRFQRYGAVHYRSTATADDYVDSIVWESVESPGVALLYTVSIASWFGDSGNWGFWGERGLGIGVAATRMPGIQWPEVPSMEWFDLEEVLDGMLPIVFKDQKVPEEFAAKLISNYGPQK
jgi:hypothetical protein